MHAYPHPATPTPQPPRRKRRILPLTVGIVVGLVLVGAILGLGTEENDGPGEIDPAFGAGVDATAQVGIGSTVRDGSFEFSVREVESGVASIGSDYTESVAQGAYVLVHLTVGNIGDEAQLLADSNQVLIDENGRRFDADTGAAVISLRGNDTFLNNINPGNTVEGTLVFDMPVDAQPVAIELHDSPFSGGVTVDLTN
ncbi:DUF4352 domain-containing protein [Actinoalloteichus hymeniacidonis]|uniref:DUF4352 family protein n=1 Tax=Actinoalloteichus hymeniacidonis TaxID=340345 RepID=A0AAC9HRY1_9PSEU|nr:DUF4352 domain-containing protein [Actinoalloteichus hymeniacidonis]AOS64268.1 putative DUF4352 family protein [Actinoalloteichus hymeniacidonis]MBB5907664.1 hypothetical protein [Actinoalloteichus hymeniacidonis]